MPNKNRWVGVDAISLDGLIQPMHGLKLSVVKIQFSTLCQLRQEDRARSRPALPTYRVQGQPELKPQIPIATKIQVLYAPNKIAYGVIIHKHANILVNLST